MIQLLLTLGIVISIVFLIGIIPGAIVEYIERKRGAFGRKVFDHASQVMDAIDQHDKDVKAGKKKESDPIIIDIGDEEIRLNEVHPKYL